MITEAVDLVPATADMSIGRLIARRPAGIIVDRAAALELGTLDTGEIFPEHFVFVGIDMSPSVLRWAIWGWPRERLDAC